MAVIPDDGLSEARPDWRSTALSPIARIEALLSDLLLIEAPEDTLQAVADARARVGANPDALKFVDGTVAAVKSYRDGAIVQMSYGLSAIGPFEHRKRAPGARNTAKELGTLLAKNHIPGVVDAFQNIGKNTEELARGNVQAFDGLLTWANDAALSLRQDAFLILVAAAAATARSVIRMPTILHGRLTFAACAQLVQELLSAGTGGAAEQYAAAAAMDALLTEWGVSGAGGIRVQTKRLNASDASSVTVGDIELLNRNFIMEAFEVTANDWRAKLQQAPGVVAARNVPRAHILANVRLDDLLANLDELKTLGTDVSVYDLRAFVLTTIGLLRVPGRDHFVHSLYDYLSTMVSDVAVVNRYVRLLISTGLTTA